MRDGHATAEPGLDIGRQPLLALQRWLARRQGPAHSPAAAEQRAETILVALQGATLLSQAHRDPGPLRRQIAALH